MLDSMKNIIIIGVGGTGSYLLPVLMRYLSSQNKELFIKIVDGDKYDEGNVSRQEFAHSRIGNNKADVQSEIYQRKFKNLFVNPVKEYIGEANIEEIIPDGSIVFCCVDNHTCRKIVSRHCQKLENVILISGGNEMVDGNVQSYFRFKGVELNEPIEVRHPEIMSTNDGDRSEMSCEQLHSLPSGSQVIFANAMSGTMMASVFFSYVNGYTKFGDDFLKPNMYIPNIWEVNDIFFDAAQVKTARIVNGQPE